MDSIASREPLGNHDEQTPLDTAPDSGKILDPRVYPADGQLLIYVSTYSSAECCFLSKIASLPIQRRQKNQTQ